MRALLAMGYRTFLAVIKTRCVKRTRRHRHSIFQIPPYRLSLTHCQLELKRTVAYSLSFFSALESAIAPLKNNLPILLMGDFNLTKID